ncbi:MAG: FAD-dependent oxidoreductase [Anaerolineales bacterium]|nr:MAG: FAD-dependent oxidoreductase [Anaerolineales bacterium]
MEKMDVVIVGAGLAGLATAYCLADEDLVILVAEKGDFPGSKNVTGGRIYLNPVRDLFPDLWNEAPLERHVVREKLTMMAETSSTTVELRSNRFDQEPYHSYTILRAKFDRWFGDKVAEKGAFVIPKSKVDNLVFQDGRVAGIVADGDEIYADVVVAADGVLSLMAEKAGLRKEQKPKHYAVSAKEVIELPRQTIEDRFNLEGDQGLAQLFFGTLTQGMMGGGFLYTNLESISLGLVVGIEALMEKEPKLEVHQMLEDFKQRPEIRGLIEGGEVAEYSAHVIIEGGIHAMPKLFGDGILVVGDAAGFGLNMLMTVRGMEYALASGAMAAQAIKRARKQNDFSAASLSYYEQLVKDSFIYKELQTFSNVLSFMENPRLFNLYPQVFCGLFEKLMWIDEQPKPKISKTVLQELRGNLLNMGTIRDAFSFLKI